MNDSEDITSILADEQSREIIKVLSTKEFTIQQISNSLNIPQSTAYRKIRKLEELKIIKKTKVIRNVDGSDESYYKNWAYEIIVKLKDGVLEYTIEHIKMEDKIVRLWQRFAE